MTSKPFEFERALKELEEITAWFESSDVDLDQGLAKFERGMELSAELKEHLQMVGNRVEKIRQRFSEPLAGTGAADGTPSAESTLPAATAQPRAEQTGDADDEDDEQAGLF